MKLQNQEYSPHQHVGAIAMGYLIGRGIEAFLHRLGNNPNPSFSTLVQIGGRLIRKLSSRIHSAGSRSGCSMPMPTPIS